MTTDDYAVLGPLGAMLATVVAAVYRALSWVYRDRIQQLTETISAYRAELAECRKGHNAAHTDRDRDVRPPVD